MYKQPRYIREDQQRSEKKRHIIGEERRGEQRREARTSVATLIANTRRSEQSKHLHQKKEQSETRPAKRNATNQTTRKPKQNAEERKTRAEKRRTQEKGKVKQRRKTTYDKHHIKYQIAKWP